MATVTLKDLMSPLSKIEAYANETSETVKRIEEFLVQGMDSNKGSNMSDKYFEKLCDVLTNGLNAKEISNSIAKQIASLNEKQLEILTEGFNPKQAEDSKKNTKKANDVLSEVLDIDKNISENTSLIAALNEKQLKELSRISTQLLSQTRAIYRTADNTDSWLGGALRQYILARQSCKKLDQIAKNTQSAIAATKGPTPKVKEKPEKMKKSNVGSRLKDLGMGALLTAKAMMRWIFVPPKVLKKFNLFVVDTLSAFENVKPKKVKAGAEAVAVVSGAAMVSGKAMMLWMFVPMSAVNKFTKYITKLSKSLAKTQPKKMKKGAKALGLMGDSIMKFAKALALSAILLIPGMIAIPFLILSMTVVGGAVALLGGKKMSQRIRRGAKALDRVGDAIKSFAIGLALFALTTMFIIMKPAVIGGMIGSLLLIPGAVAILGGKRMSKRIRRGARGLFLVGLALIPFALGLAIFSMATKGMEIGDVLIQGAVILAVGGAAALVGKFGMKNILMGALALVTNGLALWVFSMGYTPFEKSTRGLGIGDVGVQAAILVAVGGIMALAGLAVAATGGTALLGPLMYAAAGLALQELAPGLQMMKKVDFTKTDAENLSFTLGAVAAAFSGVEPEAGFLKNVGNVFSRIGQSIAGGGAAAMYIGAGKALQELSKGLNAFKEIDFTQEDSEDLAVALGSVSAAFAQAGGEPSNPGGLFGLVFGSTFSPNATERGVKSVMRSGDALTEITKGLHSFMKLQEKGAQFGEPDNDGNYEEGTLGYAITNTVGFIRTAFAAVAGEGNVQAGGFFNTLFGIKKNKVAEGIDSVRGVGKNLDDIANSVMKFQTMIEKGIKFGEPDGDGNYEEGTLGYAIVNTIGFIRTAFAAVADEGNVEAGGFFNSLFGVKKNKVAEGVDSVRGVGKDLDSIADGLLKFIGFTKDNIDFGPEGDLAKAVVGSITFISDAFAAVAGEETEDSALFGLITWNENNVEKGVSAVKGVGKDLEGIASGLETFQKMVKDKVDFKPKGELATAVKNTLTFVGDAFAAIGSNETTDSAMFGLISWDENNVEKGIKAVKGAGKELSGIAKGVATFAGVKNPAKVAKGIGTLFNSIADAFTKNYIDIAMMRPAMNHFSGWITDLADAADDGSLAKAGTDLEKIAAAINSVDPFKAEAMAGLFNGAGELGENRRAYNNLARAVEDIRDLLSENSGGGEAVTTEGGAPAAGSTGKSNNNAAMVKLNSTLSRLNSTMSRLPSQIQMITFDAPQ